MEAPNKKAAPFSFHRCEFYLSSLSLISPWILRTRTFISSHVVVTVVVIVLGVLAENVETGDEMIVFSFFAANNGRTTVTECCVLTCLTYRNVQRFRSGPVHELYGLKASQMSKVRASSHEYPHVEKSRIPSGTEFQRYMYGGPQLSRQKN